MRILFSGIIFFLLSATVFGQTGTARKHLIYFTDKAGTPYSISQPEAFLTDRAIQRRKKQNIDIKERDLPVSPQYVAALSNMGVDVWYTSRWFNAAVINSDSATLALVQALPFVKSSRQLNRKSLQKILPEPSKQDVQFNNQRLALLERDYGRAFHQANMIGAVDLHNQGFQGEGMLIAVFDAGFPGVNTAKPFEHLFQNGQLKYTYNFVDRNDFVYQRSSHGTNVLSTMGAYELGHYIGTAFKADYSLFITEDASSEHNIEEVNWLIAAERADSLGVDVINSSLGYTDFDQPSHSYNYADMDGNTTIVTRAADFAASTGILVVNSVGNEGTSPWRYLSAPSDGDSVLAVGAVDSLRRKASFSSFGPSADGRVKPNLSAQGFLPYMVGSSGAVFRGNGTSFSGPILCGMAACFWQANPALTNMQVIEVLQQSASQATNPDSLLGYGIPNAKRALELASQLLSENYSLYPNPVPGNSFTIQLPFKEINKNVEVQVYDMIGRQIFENKYQNQFKEFEVNLEGRQLVPGIYVVTVTTDTDRQTIRFMKF